MAFCFGEMYLDLPGGHLDLCHRIPKFKQQISGFRWDFLEYVCDVSRPPPKKWPLFSAGLTGTIFMGQIFQNMGHLGARYMYCTYMIDDHLSHQND